jgi:transcriptional regulator with XRE-family HTH domain
MKGEPPHRLDVAIGERIRTRRKAMRMSQGALARAVGVTFQQVQKYERGANRISFSRLMDIARVLQCRLSDLAEGLDEGDTAAGRHRVDPILALEGATELLEAYSALPNEALRRTLLQHARALAGAVRETGKNS